VSRNKVLDEVADKLPQLYAFVLACYGSDPCMTFGVQEEGGFRLLTILSKEGVQQGDPIGPLLCALVMHLVLRATMQSHPDLPMLPAFLDDAQLPGPPQVVARALQTMVQHGSDLAGLRINMGKCEVYAGSPDADLGCFPADVRGARGEKLPGFVVLGRPVGGDEYVRQQVGVMAEKALDVLPALASLACPQLAQLALSFCVRPRVVHLLRGCEPDLIAEPMRSHHEGIMASLAGPDAAVLRGPRLDPLAERFVALPPRFGGLGFTRGERVADAAFFAAFALEWAHVLRLFPEVITERALTDAVSGVGRLGAVKLARERLQSESDQVQVMLAGIADDEMLPAGVVRTPVEIPTLDDVRQGPIKGLQKRLASISATLDSLQLREIVMRGDERTRVWYHSVAFPDSVANDFWSVIPSYQTVQVSPTHFPIAARMHLLQRQPVLAAIHSCRKCQQEVDQEGMHFMQCRPRKDMGLGDPFSAVHDALAREVASALRKVYPGGVGLSRWRRPVGTRLTVALISLSLTTMGRRVSCWWRCLLSAPWGVTTWVMRWWVRHWRDTSACVGARITRLCLRVPPWCLLCAISWGGWARRRPALCAGWRRSCATGGSWSRRVRLPGRSS